MQHRIFFVFFFLSQMPLIEKSVIFLGQELETQSNHCSWDHSEILNGEVIRLIHRSASMRWAMNMLTVKGSLLWRKRYWLVFKTTANWCVDPKHWCNILLLKAKWRNMMKKKKMKKQCLKMFLLRRRLVFVEYLQELMRDMQLKVS